MTLRKKLLPTANNPVSGQTATINLDLGQKVHTIWLTLGDADGNLISVLVKEIRLLINGKVQRRMLADELNQLNYLNGVNFGAVVTGTPGEDDYRTHLPIFLAEPWRKTNGEAAALAWNLGGPSVSSASIEVDFFAGLTAPVINGWYEWSPLEGGLGAITKWIRQTLGASGSTQDFNNVFTRGDFYHAFHFFKPTGTYVERVRLTLDGVIIQDVINVLQNNAMLTNRGLVPQLDLSRFDLILDADDPINSALATAGSNELTIHVEYNDTAPATGNLVVLIEKSGPPE